MAIWHADTRLVLAVSKSTATNEGVARTAAGATHLEDAG